MAPKNSKMTPLRTLWGSRWLPKWAQSRPKDPSETHWNFNAILIASRDSKWSQNGLQIRWLFLIKIGFLEVSLPTGPRMALRGREAPSEDYLGTHSHPTSRNLSRSAYRTCTCRVSNSRGCGDDPPQASSINSWSYLINTLVTNYCYQIICSPNS